MKISYNWLKEYLKFDLTPEETAKHLTDCGLEVEGIETFESVKGGLRGLVIGHVCTCEAHPNSDHLHVTTVNVGQPELLHVVCGAANVAAGQKVVVATVGTVLYTEDSSFTIKKSKIRGEVSEGMICAEDEIGIGESHDGIMVLPEEAVVGTLAADYFGVETDYVLEIGLTPNRSDATSHIGVARDLFAILMRKGIPCGQIITPSLKSSIPVKGLSVDINIENRAKCPRYSGRCFENIEVKPSPKWLQNRLKAIGVRPINNVVDITQFVMFEIGQPLHAFDASKVKGNKVIVKTLEEGTIFKTLDEKEIKLSADDLMICNEKEPMCLAGVFGGADSGVTENTTAIFLESAYFEPTTVRLSSKRHSLKTDAAFRFERGANPDITIYALKRAEELLCKYANATVSSDIIDVYPTYIEKKTIYLDLNEVNRIVGENIDSAIISTILMNLGFEVQSSGTDRIGVTVPLNKTDITRPIDLIEDILRIYGYNNVTIPKFINYHNHSIVEKSGKKLNKEIAQYLVANGYYEIVNNSLTKEEYFEKYGEAIQKQAVRMMNPLSSELAILRQTLLLQGLETIARNNNFKNPNLPLFEIGKTYQKLSDSSEENNQEITRRFEEKKVLAIWLSGKTHDDTWNNIAPEYTFYHLKNVVNNLLTKMGVAQFETTVANNHFGFLENLVYHKGEQVIAKLGQVAPLIANDFDIKKPVYYAEIDLEVLYTFFENKKTIFSPIVPFPAVKRDLALLVDSNITYQQLEKIAYQYGSNKLQKVSLFDVYEGDKIEAGKKSYALNFTLQNSSKTLADEEIHKIMNKLIAAFERECGAKLR